MRTLIISSLLLVAGACDRDTRRDGAGTAGERTGMPTDLSTTGQPIPPASTFGTGDSSERASNLPGTADTGAMHETTGFATSGPMGTGGGGYTTGTTGVGGNQGIPTTQPNPNVGRTDTKNLDQATGSTHHADDGRAQTTARLERTDAGVPRAINDMTGRANDNIGTSDDPREGANDTPGIDGGNSSSAGTGSTTTLGDMGGGTDRGQATAKNTKNKPAPKRQKTAAR